MSMFKPMSLASTRTTYHQQSPNGIPRPSPKDLARIARAKFRRVTGGRTVTKESATVLRELREGKSLSQIRADQEFARTLVDEVLG